MDRKDIRISSPIEDAGAVVPHFSLYAHLLNASSVSGKAAAGIRSLRGYAFMM